MDMVFLKIAQILLKNLNFSHIFFDLGTFLTNKRGGGKIGMVNNDN